MFATREAGEIRSLFVSCGPVETVNWQEPVSNRLSKKQTRNGDEHPSSHTCREWPAVQRLLELGYPAERIEELIADLIRAAAGSTSATGEQGTGKALKQRVRAADQALDRAAAALTALARVPGAAQTIPELFRFLPVLDIWKEAVERVGRKHDPDFDHARARLTYAVYSRPHPTAHHRKRQYRDAEIAEIVTEVQNVTGMSAGRITAEDQRQWRKKKRNAALLEDAALRQIEGGFDGLRQAFDNWTSAPPNP